MDHCSLSEESRDVGHMTYQHCDFLTNAIAHVQKVKLLSKFRERKELELGLGLRG